MCVQLAQFSVSFIILMWMTLCHQTPLGRSQTLQLKTIIYCNRSA
eukprot:COSAG02_NODE_8356_length_2600_cov_1.436226_3_plen_44_part_01